MDGTYTAWHVVMTELQGERDRCETALKAPHCKGCRHELRKQLAVVYDAINALHKAWTGETC